MPARYYSVRLPQERPLVEFFVLDLNPIAALLPPVMNAYWSKDGQFMTEQAAWLDSALAESTAKWKIVCTHHPYLSNGTHGNAGQYDGIPFAPANGQWVKEFFEAHVLGRAQFILSGHDHCLQVLEPNAASKGTRQIVSGAAAKTTHKGADNPALFENFGDVGFMTLDLTDSTADLGVFTVDPSTAQATNAFQRRLA